MLGVLHWPEALCQCMRHTGMFGKCQVAMHWGKGGRVIGSPLHAWSAGTGCGWVLFRCSMHPRRGQCNIPWSSRWSTLPMAISSSHSLTAQEGRLTAQGTSSSSSKDIHQGVPLPHAHKYMLYSPEWFIYLHAISGAS